MKKSWVSSYYSCNVFVKSKVLINVKLNDIFKALMPDREGKTKKASKR